MRNRVFVALVHYPVYNKLGKWVATSVTNFDIHDISRCAKTYDIENYYIITPVDSQKELTNRIIGFWKSEDGERYNEDRVEAFSSTIVIDSIENAIEDIKNRTGLEVETIATSARNRETDILFEDMSKLIYNENKAYLILLGTGWGLIDGILDNANYVLKPIRPNAKYNHLSVRSAASIILDRLFGDN